MKDIRDQPATRCAIVGLSAIFPGSVSLSDYWNHIVQKTDLISEVPPSHWLKEDYYCDHPTSELKTWCARGGFLPKIGFDPVEFGIPPAALSAIDTVQLLTLMAARDALNDTVSFREKRVDRKRTGVIIGAVGTMNLVEQMCAKLQKPVWVQALRRHGLPESQVQKICQDIEQSYPEWTENTFPGSLSNVIAGRVAHRFDLGGTSCTVDAACASSLAAVRMAVHELLAGAVDLVLAGGADAMNSITMFMSFTKTPALSRTGECRPYAQAADGVLLGEGIGLLTLKRLADAERDGDRIYAVIAGIGSSSDGSDKSIYAPSAKGQALALQRAYAQAGFPLEEVELIEGHGTATSAGDAAELQGLKFAADGSQKRQTCALGSVKSQIGHLKAAAGAAGLVKAAMAIRNGVLPATLKVDCPHAGFSLADSLFYVNTETRPWIHSATSPRRAGVSAMGFGGTNFHLVLEEYRHAGRDGEQDTLSPVHLLLFSGSQTEGVLAEAENCLGRVAAGDLSEIARTTQAQYSHHQEARLAIIITDLDAQKSELLKDLGAIRSNPRTPLSKPQRLYYEFGPVSPGKIAWVFAGQGSQYVGMGAELLVQFPLARAIWDTAADVVFDAGLALHHVTYPIPAFTEESRRAQDLQLRDTRWAQPAIGALAAAQIALLRACGLKPDCVAGHSYGELPALYAAGVIPTVEDLLLISRQRGEVLAQACLEKGAMSSVLADHKRVSEVIAAWGTGVSIANLNSPKQTVITGSCQGIAEVEMKLKELGLSFQRLNVDTCFHSPSMAGGTAVFAAWLEEVQLKSPVLPVYSNVTGLPYTAEVSSIKTLLAAQLSQPVRFQALIEQMVAGGVTTFLELGPGTVLSRLIKDCVAPGSILIQSVDSGPRHSPVAAFWNALGRLAVQGVPIDTKALWAGVRIPDSGGAAVPSAATAYINGTNYQRRYPPANGAAGLLPPNPEPAPPPEPPLPDRNGDPSVPVYRHAGPDREIIESIQQKAYTAQIQLQNALAESHHEFLRMSQAAIASLGGAAELPLTAEPRLPASVAFENGTEGKHPAQIMAGPKVLPTAPKMAAASPQVPPSVPLPSIMVSPSPAAGAARGPSDPKAVILKVVAEKTGYPVELLKMDAQLESDLGVDSIKRVEILSALQTEFPALVNANMAELIGLNTLGEILEYAAAHQNGSTPSAGPEASTGPQAHTVSAPSLAAAEPVRGAGDPQAVILKVVAEKTGYPVELLKMDAQLESDLGVDSIKRVEILSALQTEFPALVNANMAELIGLNTLGEILGYALAHQSQRVPVSAAEPDASREAQVHINRYRVIRRPLGRLEPRGPGLAGLGALTVIPDNRGIAEAFAAKLRAVASIKLEIRERLADPGSSVLYLRGLNSLGAADPFLEMLDILKGGFDVAREMGSGVAGRDGGMFLAAFDDTPNAALPLSLQRTWLSGLAGLTKSLAKEWPKLVVRSVGIDSAALAPDLVAERLLAELSANEPEVYLEANGDRWEWACQPEELCPGIPVLRTNDLILVTGGARGVTAQCLMALARKDRFRFAILGRSQFCTEDAATAGSRRELIAALAASAQAQGETALPLELDRRAARILASREIAATLAAVRNAGSEAEYYPVNILDERQIAEAVEIIRGQAGPIQAIVHGAGVIADHLIHRKTDADYEAVFHTKVLGLKHVLDATAVDAPKLVCNFTSVAGRFGNAGQSDYAMANEVLNKLSTSHPGMLSINWGPWAGGMVNPGLAARFKAMNIALIPLEAGAELFADELFTGGGAARELVIAAADAAGETRHAEKLAGQSNGAHRRHE